MSDEKEQASPDKGAEAAQESGNAGCDPLRNFAGRSRLDRIADFLFEAGMLRKTPRTGYQFLGSGAENVAEHSFRVALIAYVLASLCDADPMRAAMLGLIHDFHEARTGDFNYVNSIYNSSKQRLAMQHALKGTGLSGALLPLWDEQNGEESLEALLAADADQLDLILNLVEERDLGNPYARAWLEAALGRMRTDTGRELAARITASDHTDWWFKGPDPKWWIKKDKGS
ncbi:HD domain-containing protein [Desulfovibrio sp. OttesenSCG-928-A18]|nr:HD domain-containing protein [Desulfovibrio sp. OttesenSCG-928-A18]